jgi:SPP1 family predicted phage head-tail adaptor
VNSTFADFTKPFKIQSLNRVSDGQGGVTTTWSDFANAVGFVEQISGGEVLKVIESGSKIDDAEMYTFQFEFITGVTLDMRIFYNGETYNIKGIKPLQDVDVWLMVTAEKGEPT